MRDVHKSIGFLFLTIGCGALAQPSFAAESQRLAQMEEQGGSFGGDLGGASRARTQRSAPVKAKARASFEGAWSVSTSGPCISAGTSQVTIEGSRIIGPGGSGSVSPSGAVSTLASFNGMTVVGKGQITGRSAHGTYKQSDGCSGTWSAIKL